MQYRPCEAKPFLPFQVSVPLKRVIRPVSSNRHIKPDVRVSSPGEFHPQALSELDVNLSAHPAPVIQP